MLALSNKDGVISSSIPGLADMARVSIDDCEKALTEFMSPDTYSRTPDYDGRRIEVLDGVGWRLFNHAKYRDDPASRMQPADEKVGKVYFIKCGDAIKIGFSQNPWARVATLKTAMPENPVLLGSFNGVMQDEKDLHVRFKHLRINREWFRADAELLEHIQERLGVMVVNGSDYGATTMDYNNTDTDTDTDTEADTETKPDNKEDICRVVFDAWSQVMKHPKAKYDLKRKKRIQARLSEGFTVEDLKQVPHGAVKSAWHMGENPANTKYDDIDTIYRDAAQVEKFLVLARNGHGNQSEGCDICRNHPNRSHISLKTYGWIFNTETKQLEDCICKNGTA